MDVDLFLLYFVFIDHFKATIPRLCHSYGVTPDPLVFSFQIPNNGFPQPNYNPVPFPFPATAINKIIRIEPLKAKHVITTSWFLPPFRQEYRRHPCRLLANLIGHEGPGSLLALLKKRSAR